MADVTNVTPRPHAKPEIWRPKFLATLARCGVVSEAARVAKVARPCVYRAREEDAEFAEAWDSAMEEALDLLELAAFRRAKTISDPLLKFLLTAHRPEKYRETIRQEHSGTITILTAEQLQELSDDDLRAYKDRLRTGAGGGGGGGTAARLRVAGGS